MDSLPNKELFCHRTGFEKSCRDLVVSGKCGRWMEIRGKNPNTGEPVAPWDCVDNWIPILLMDNAQQHRQAAAAIESLRNENVAVGSVLARIAGPRKIIGQD